MARGVMSRHGAEDLMMSEQQDAAAAVGAAGCEVAAERGSAAPAGPTDCTWQLEVRGDCVRFIRWPFGVGEGVPDEVYGWVSRATAAVYAAAIIQGYQPPRDLLPCDAPFRRTQSG